MSDQPSTPKTIFLHALEIPSPEARQAYIVEQCGGDEALSAEVHALLRHHQELGSFLEPAAAHRATSMDTRSLTEGAGTMIGPYKLLEQIGEGGMGVVFMAEQQEPVRRKVAVKLIKPGMDTRQVIARFEAERQALAVMDHPSIAKVLDAGTTPSGHPYFVMELVRGVPITTYCDENNLAIRERLELFASVCQAIQHAHTKGIVHRDIKPSNVLITRQDGRSAVKVIDFGVAKAIGQQLTEKTLFTNFAQMIGTPLYMSPEQAEQCGVDIDTRSDVYSLGVLLYELLTGSTPVDADRLKQAAFDEIRRIIREDEPQTPSARISGSHTLPAIAAQRHIEPARLSKLLRGELDWIVMKALEKDRGRRYETANAFAADMLHYLNDEPVQACPPSATYRFGKFARRNRVAITTATLVALALVLGTIVSTWQAIRAETARAAEAEQATIAEAARAAEAKQRKVAEGQQREAEKQRELAEANFRKARKAVDEYFTLVSESTLLDVPGLQPLRKELLDAALRFYQKTAAERTNDPDVLADVAATYLRISQIDLALNRSDDAVVALREALDIIDRLHREHPNERESQLKLAGLFTGQRKILTGLEHPRDSLAAFQTLLRWAATWEKLAADHPSIAGFQADLVGINSVIGSFLRYSGRPQEGPKYLRKSTAIGESLVRQYPDAPEHRSALAYVNRLLAGNLAANGVEDEPLTLIRRSVELGEVLVAEFPNVPAYRLELAQSLVGLGIGTTKQRPQEAEKHYRRAMELSESLVREFPGAETFKYTWSVANNDLANQAAVNENSALVEETLRSRIRMQEMLAAYKHDDHRIRIDLAETLRRLAGHLARDPSRSVEEKELDRRASAVLTETAALVDKTLVADQPGNPDTLADLLTTYNEIAQMQTGEERVKTVQRAKELTESLVGEFPGGDLATRIRLVEVLSRQGRFDEAAKALDRADENDSGWEYQRGLLYVQTKQLDKYRRLCRTMLMRVGQTDDARVASGVGVQCKLAPNALTDYTPVLNLLDKAVNEQPRNRHFLGVQAHLYYRSGQAEPAAKQLEVLIASDEIASIHQPFNKLYLAMAHHGLGHDAEAERYLREGAEWIDKNGQEKLQEGAVLTQPLGWELRLELRLLRKEVEELIKPSDQ